MPGPDPANSLAVSMIDGPFLPASWVSKRIFDVSLASLSLGLVSLPLVFVAVLVRLIDGRPVLFRQSRPGLHGRLFTIYKFRTMRMLSEGQDQDMSDAARLTQLGRILRRVSADELPELFNVVRGEMSLVGPRPLLPEYLDRYTTWQARRHEVKPGITGWAQVHGRNRLTWEQKLELDVWYVDNWSLRLDIKILWMTVIQVIRGDGVSADGHSTMPEFKGTSVE